jgi:hypothetical protein
MNITLLGYDRTKRPWFGKVVNRAREDLGEILRDVEWIDPPELFAAFDTEQGDTIVLEERIEDGESLISIVFAARNWRDVQSSRSEAVAQLAAAVTALAPPAVAERVEVSVRGAGYAKDFSLRRSRVHARRDRRLHLVVMLGEGLHEDSFMELYGRLDLALQNARAGEVTGSGFGIGGWNLDVSLQRKPSGKRILREELARLPKDISCRVNAEGSEENFQL